MEKIEYSNHQDKDRFSITPSGFFGKSSDMIQARDNFMTAEELSFLSDAARSITICDITQTHYNEEGTVIYDSKYWDDRVCTGERLDLNNKNISPAIKILQDRLT